MVIVLDALSQARLITADADRGAALLFARAVRLRGPVRRATAVATAHGVYELTINGRPVTDTVLNPGWTTYQWRLQYQQFDVTELLRDSTTAGVEARVGNGWYRGDLGFAAAKANYGDELGFLCAIVIEYDDGTDDVIGTDRGWAASTCEITASSLYDGQRIDVGAPRTPLVTRELDLDASTLVPQSKPQLVRHESIRPVAVWTSPSGATLLDFGQNLVGWIRLRVTGAAGTELVVRHAEVLEEGELGTRPLRHAKATDSYVLSGGDDSFEPSFTFHGFRYAQIDGWPVAAALDAEAVVVHTELTRTIEFECSDPLVTRLVQNSIWSQRGNFFDVPIDCPQRDERLGWTGDIAAYAATAALQFDSAEFLHSWLLDLALDTAHNPRGKVPNFVPDISRFAGSPGAPVGETEAQAIWGDAAVWVPEALWNVYGDVGMLAAEYPGIVMHLESVLPRLSGDGLWNRDWQFGDWLDPDAPPDRPWLAKADPGVVATACLFRSASFAARAAEVLGRDEDRARWASLAERTRAAFLAAYVDEAARTITSDCATVYSLAIAFGLLEGQTRRWAGDRLAELVRASGFRVPTGFAGTPYVTWALSETGHVDEAYGLLLQRECPSWLYPVTMGATTTWERWDSMLPDGTINPGEMTSFNHYAFGAVADWIYQVVAGIRPGSPGYQTVRIRPQPGPGIEWVRAAYDSRAGRIESKWTTGSGRFELEVVVPQGVEAEVVLPDGSTRVVVGGSHAFTV